ncbi:hypothetical protein [Caldimonas thermodepolymerans]|jgi:hypothetical protein|uniref:hypothetical protein n=1 Tax=Caldimonas thermodepolymerans TaxID=215580 RepID=UPI00223626D9|nr:hypothetical protein [Caldimonas thermodepolymerans]UZG45154.1 hypothetical protein ONZ46_04165 [Caldimonas thermodepolymerans]
MQAGKRGGQLFATLGVVVSAGSLGWAGYLGEVNPAWCVAPFVGCLGAVLVVLGAGWFLGAGLAGLALWRSAPGERSRTLAWCVLGWHLALAALAVWFAASVRLE